MFDETYQGYYIHGVSPYGYSEISAEKLRKSLKFEQSGKAQIRGMTNEHPDLQTFEIFMPEHLMRKYKTELYSKYVMECEAIAKGQNVQNNAAVNAFTPTRDVIPSNLDIDKLDGERKVMNRLMQRFVE